MKQLLLILSAIVLISTTSLGQALSNFERELAKHHYSIALAVPSSALDEYPLFSPDQHYLAFNLNGKWRKIALSEMRLTGATWLRMNIGYPEAEVIKNWNLKKKELQTYKDATTNETKKLVLSNGTIVEFIPEGLGTSLYITPKNGSAQKIWSTGMEPCYNFAVGANENLVAFICPSSGMLIMDINQTLKESALRIDSANTSGESETAKKSEEQQEADYILEKIKATMAEKYSLTAQGERLLYAGKPEEAIEILEKALVKDPHNAKTYLNLGHAHTAVGKHQEALEHYRTANNLKPSQNGFFSLGSSHLMLHNHGEAIKHLSRVIAMDKEDYKAYRYRAIAYMLNGNTEKACEDYHFLKSAGYKDLTMKELRKGCK